MPNSPISGLPAAGALAAANPFPTVQAGVTVQTPLSAIAAFAQSGAPVPLHPGYVSGRFYSNALRFAVPLTTVSQTLNTVNYSPIEILQPVTITSFGIKTGGTNAAAGNANIGLYANASGVPGALLQTIAAGVAIPATANTNITITPGGGNFTLQPGSYWFAVQLDTTINMAGDTTSASNLWFGGSTNSAAWFVATSAIIGYTEAAAFAGGLPVAATPVASTSAVTSGILKVA
jgi:hypothetical protein